MNENFMEDISLSQLADIGNMSVFHFNRLFKKITDFYTIQIFTQRSSSVGTPTTLRTRLSP